MCIFYPFNFHFSNHVVPVTLVHPHQEHSIVKITPEIIILLLKKVSHGTFQHSVVLAASSVAPSSSSNRARLHPPNTAKAGVDSCVVAR